MTSQEELGKRLIENRVEFKLYAAQQLLDHLKGLEKTQPFSSSDMNRVIWEKNLECLLAHLVGSIDALLIRINDKLNLGLDIKYVSSSAGNVSSITKELNDRGKGKLLDNLSKAIQPKNWLWTLKDLRNQGLHTNLINKHVALGGTITIVSLITDPQTNLEVIPYLEDNFDKESD